MMRLMLLVLATSLMLLGCVRTPTQSSAIVDDRPRVSFDTSQLPQQAKNYQVQVDGIDYGSVEQYRQNKNTLPLLPGQHTIEVILDGQLIFSKKVYLGENSSRVIKVVQYD